MTSPTLMMTKKVNKGEKIFPDLKKVPVAIAEENFNSGDIGEIDNTVSYPVDYQGKMYILPGLKKIKKREKKCQDKLKKKG